MGEQPAVIVIFGGSGDLTKRKVLPALYNLFLDGHMPDQFEVLGVARTPLADEEWRGAMKEAIAAFSRQGAPSETGWNAFAPHLHYISAGYEDSSTYLPRIQEMGKDWATAPARILYMATPPELFQVVARAVRDSDVAQDRSGTRIVLEKPFGRDLVSARNLTAVLTETFDESQIHRIDHYLGKETVQNILALRFANAVWEPIWDRRYIDHVQITVSEELGVGHRGGYYDQAGALRDMVQNHLLQLVCLIAMEPPVSFAADEIRNRKVDVLNAIRPMSTKTVPLLVVRGQYGPGAEGGVPVPGYRQEERVDPQSETETFIALKLFVDNWRWQGVPFYLRTGKRLPTRASEVSLQFQPVPHQPFPAAAVADLRANRLVIGIEPDEGVWLQTEAKRPGLEMIIGSVGMHYTYKEAFQAPSVDAYETLLLDVMRGDQTLFMRADQEEAAWSVLTPILDFWAEAPAGDFPNYPAGSWGPEDADTLVVRDGRSWRIPSVLSPPGGAAA
jgi:glucose-6-phosphate 1-dehydrogenase